MKETTNWVWWDLSIWFECRNVYMAWNLWSNDYFAFQRVLGCMGGNIFINKKLNNMFFGLAIHCQSESKLYHHWPMLYINISSKITPSSLMIKRWELNDDIKFSFQLVIEASSQQFLQSRRMEPSLRRYFHFYLQLIFSILTVFDENVSIFDKSPKLIHSAS